MEIHVVPDHPLLSWVSALLSFCTSYSNRNLIFQAIVVFPLPYFYCCCCCLEYHRPPLCPLPPPPPCSEPASVFLYLYLSNSAFCPHSLSSFSSLVLFSCSFTSLLSVSPPVHTSTFPFFFWYPHPPDCRSAVS